MLRWCSLSVMTLPFFSISLDLLSVCSLMLSDANTPTWQQHGQHGIREAQAVANDNTYTETNTWLYLLDLGKEGKGGRAGMPPAETE